MAGQAARTFTRAEVKKHNDSKSTWLIIENNVYDVTTFLQEHPGGEETLLEEAGKEATKAFLDIGHSTEARELMEKYHIGEIVEAEKITLEESFCLKRTIRSNVKKLKPYAPYIAASVVLVGAFVAYRVYRSSH